MGYRERRGIHLINPETEVKKGLDFGLYIPQALLTNDEIASWNVQTAGGHTLTTGDIFSRTGVERRHIAQHDETSLHMGRLALKEALNGKRRADVVLVSTSYPHKRHMASSFNETERLGAIVTHDFFAACSGFANMISFIKAYEGNFAGLRVALVSTEKYSGTLFDLSSIKSARKNKIPADPSLAQTLFSDGAAAMVFTYGRDLSVLASSNKTFPFEYHNAIRMPIDRSNMVYTFSEIFVPNSRSGRFEQDGRKVYQGVMHVVPPLVEQVVEKAGLQPSDIALVIPHQASGKVIDGLQERLPDYPVLKDMRDGNFSSASIPIALEKAINQGLVVKGDRIVVVGFGAGMYASSSVVQF